MAKDKSKAPSGSAGSEEIRVEAQSEKFDLASFVHAHEERVGKRCTSLLVDTQASGMAVRLKFGGADESLDDAVSFFSISATPAVSAPGRQLNG